MFCTKLYKDTFAEALKEDEFTHGDEILVDMEEPDGDRISYIMMHHGHSVSDCKAFVTTTDENVLIAVFDLWGRFYKCYIIKNSSIKNVRIENVFGGKEIIFDGESQYGKVSVKLSAPNRQFGTDLKFQREHLQLFADNLQKISENPKCFLQERQSVSCNDNSGQIDTKHLNIEQFSSEQREPDDESNEGEIEQIHNKRTDLPKCIDSEDIAIDLSIVELTDAQRRLLIGDRKYEDFDIESRNLDITCGVYEANRDIILTITSSISPGLTKDGGWDYFCIIYQGEKYGVTYGFNWVDKKLNGIHNRTPFCQNVVESIFRYYEDSFHERCEMESTIIKKFEEKYNTKIHDFLKFYIENVIDTHKKETL